MLRIYVFCFSNFLSVYLFFVFFFFFFFYFFFFSDYYRKIYSTCLDSNDCGVCVFVLHFLSFFFIQLAMVDKSTVNSASVHCLRVLQITLFSNFFIKNGSHGTIYTFKNYFPTVFSVSVFNFNKNKFNSNGSIYREILGGMLLHTRKD